MRFDVEVDDLKGLITKAIDNQVDKNGVPLKAIDKDLDNSWGFEYDKNVRAAQRALDVYGDDDIITFNRVLYFKINS